MKFPSRKAENPYLLIALWFSYGAIFFIAVTYRIPISDWLASLLPL
jgi:hypothetical protein